MGCPSPADPRGALERAVQRASEMGFSVFAHPEIEFPSFTPARGYINHLNPLTRLAILTMSAARLSNGFRCKIVHALEDMEFKSSSHHEASWTNEWICVRPTRRAADNIMTAKTSSKRSHSEECSQPYARFFADQQGSNAHAPLAFFAAMRTPSMILRDATS